MAEAVEIARLRLFLALVAAARTVDDLEPLPNIDFNILPGNSLIGLLRVDPAAFDRHTQTGIGRVTQQEMFGIGRAKSYHEIVAEKNRLVAVYQDAATYTTGDLQALRDNILAQRQEANAILNKILLDEFGALNIQFEQATWDAPKNAEGKPKKRPLTLADMDALQPFHWGYEFDEVMNERGGFDAIITNPPWEIFKSQAKEFFAEYSDLVTKNKMRIEEFQKQQTTLLSKPDIQKAWLSYLCRFPHQSLYFRNSAQYQNQRAVVYGRTTGSDVNLYKLFTEQCFNLLRRGGECGIVIPSGIYTDLGATGLRKMLFEQTQITGLFGFENRKMIFEGVDSRFKFVVLTFAKGGATIAFSATFMRHEPAELASFPNENALLMSVDLVRRLSPEPMSLMEFDNKLDIKIADKMTRFPLFGEVLSNTWNAILTNEFHMTNHSYLFKTKGGSSRLPLYEGKMIHQFDHLFAEPRYWVDKNEGRKAVLGRMQDKGQTLGYQTYRLGFRDIASSTNERTMISTIIPPTFHGNKIPTVKVFDEGGKRLIDNKTQLFLCAIWNSFCLDWVIRMKVTTTLNFFYIYQLPVPRLTAADPAFTPIVERAAKLICTTPEFDDLAAEVGLGSHQNGVTAPAQRAQLRAELDGLIAHVYGLTEAEFSHILSTFPLVAQPVKVAAQNAYRDVERGLIK